jgi:hypothetical protein
MIVRKKGKKNDEREGSSSMMVAHTYDIDEDGIGDAEKELYRLMRGYDSEIEEEEDEVDSTGVGEEDSEVEAEPVVPPVGQIFSAPEWGSSSSAPECGSSSNTSSSTATIWVPTYIPSELISWNSGPEYQRPRVSK